MGSSARGRDPLHLLGQSVDLDGTAETLMLDLLRAVPSAVGLELRITGAAGTVSLSRYRPGARPQDVVTSLRVPLPRGVTPEQCRVTFYAARAGALVDLAADLALALRSGQDSLRLDADLPTSATSGLRGLEGAAELSRAEGVLIEQGVPLEHVPQVLAARARRAGLDLVDYARQVVQEAIDAAGDGR